MKNTICFILIFISAAALYGEEQNNDKKKSDEINIIKFKKKLLSFKTQLIRQSLIVKVEDKNNKRSLNFEPNVSWRGGVKASYKAFSVGTSKKIPFMGEDDKKGDTDYSDLQLSFFKWNLGADVIYQEYKGFHLGDGSSIENHYDNGDYINYRDLNLTNISANLIYWLNRDFSYKAAFNQSEIQLKSCGTFLFMLSPGYFKMDNDHSVIPLTESSSGNFSDLPGLSGFKFYSIALSAGYGYNLIYKRFFISPSISIGDSIQKQKFNINGNDISRWMWFN